MSFGAHVTSYDPTDKSVTINAVKLDFGIKKNWILDDNYNKYDLKRIDPAPKGGVRKIDFSPSGAVIKFSTGKGVVDSDSNTFAISNYDMTDDRFIFAPG